MISVLLWFAFAIILFLYSLRMHQTAEYRDRIALVLAAGGVAVLVATAIWAGPVHALLMVIAGVVLTVVMRPLMARVAARLHPAAPPVDVAGRRRLDRLSRGEMSLDEYFKEGDRKQPGPDQRRPG